MTTEELLNGMQRPRTTVARFAADLKARIASAEVGFTAPGQEAFVNGLAYARGIVDAALSDYDTRDPQDFARLASGK